MNFRQRYRHRHRRSFTTGFVPLDSSHKELWVNVARVEYLIERRNWDSVLDELEVLITATRSHFSEEEKLMRKHGVANLRLHMNEHYVIVEALFLFREMCLRRRSEMALRNQFELFCQTLIKHLEGSDAQAADAIVKGV